MNTEDLLQSLRLMASNADETGVARAEAEISDFVLASEERSDVTARALSEVQVSFAKAVPASPFRNEVIDLLGDHVLKLLDPN